MGKDLDEKHERTTSSDEPDYRADSNAIGQLHRPGEFRLRGERLAHGAGLLGSGGQCHGDVVS